jgi:K+-transporting ATPase KdpF subunit
LANGHARRAGRRGGDYSQHAYTLSNRVVGLALPAAGLPRKPEVRMGALNWLGLLLSLAVAIYLLVALLRPEKFE